MISPKHKQKNIQRGSALVFALIIMALILTATFSLVAVTSIERKNSGATAKSVAAFQVANNGVEKVLKRIYKDNDTSITALSTSIGGGACNNGSFTVVNASGGWQYSATFLLDNDTPLPCSSSNADWRTPPADPLLNSIKVVGSYAGTIRAVQAPVVFGP